MIGSFELFNLLQSVYLETAVKDGGDSTLASTSDKQVAIETGQYITCDVIAPFMPLNYEETTVGLRLTITMISKCTCTEVKSLVGARVLIVPHPQLI